MDQLHVRTNWVQKIATTFPTNGLEIARQHLGCIDIIQPKVKRTLKIVETFKTINQRCDSFIVDIAGNFVVIKSWRSGCSYDMSILHSCDKYSNSIHSNNLNLKVKNGEEVLTEYRKSYRGLNGKFHRHRQEHSTE